MNKIAAYGLMLILTGASVCTTPKVTAYGHNIQKPSVEYINSDKAREIAFADAGLKESQVTLLKNKLDYDDGMAVYEIEFTYDSEKYEYKIDAVSGTIQEYSKKLTRRYTTDKTKTISLSQAKEIALKLAGKEGKDVSFTKEVSYYDDGRREYDIEFVADNIRYEIEIRSDGTVSEYSYQRLSENSHAGSQITMDEAKAIALKHAGLTSTQVTYTKTDADYDDGRLEYEVEFIYNGTVYEYTINASDGRIINFDRD